VFCSRLLSRVNRSRSQVVTHFEISPRNSHPKGSDGTQGKKGDSAPIGVRLRITQINCAPTVKFATPQREANHPQKDRR
jgi:hypothetical protein